MTTLYRGGTDYFYKKHCIISGALLASLCLFLSDTPGGAARGVILYRVLQNPEFIMFLFVAEKR
ncbi:hypothetical protein CE665_25640 [Salmonella enterica subsp. enterica serovar Poona]|nr:hypothetical protein LFZ28_25350 [Salmonella enterica subsp. enterica serovar Milwaukee str. SA19950795]EAO1480999.1 hypothetical protein [Salmonella enterica]ECI8026950.1 hypothetical protein [Salmonella enterica subsp. enterica serovar Ramatgan]ECO1514556.1 hypothetical protein [Salmonella enterica subsp. arizonae]EDJ2557687.1 hypothetical protein [Salmonella enterica subsp. enterica serovar Poona]EDL3487795.1 hypothetical protein [Salmonella enterica subsp. enterica serovar Newport]EDV1